MAEPTGELADVVARIVAPEPSSPAEPDATVAAPTGLLTGELAALARWWSAIGASRTLTAEEIACGPGGILDGVRAADRAIDAGATLLIPRVAVRDTVGARTVIAMLTRREASAVVHQPTGMSDAAWMREVGDVRDTVARLADLRAEPERLADELGTGGMAVAVGVLLGAAARRTPCVIDGTDELASALIADRICYRAKGWWRAGTTSPDAGRSAAVDRIDLTAGVPLSLSDDAGMGAQATLALLRLAIEADR